MQTFTVSKSLTRSAPPWAASSDGYRYTTQFRYSGAIAGNAIYLRLRSRTVVDPGSGQVILLNLIAPWTS